MNNRKRAVSLLAGIMAGVLLITLILGLLPTQASAASSSEIRQQINQLQAEKKEIQKQIEEVKADFKENEDEIENTVNRKNVIDQEIQLLTEQIVNINAQISAFNVLIADKQDELDAALERYRTMNADNLSRIRAMEEEGEVSYWEVLFKANSFVDLLDRINMVEEIAASDKRRLKEMSEAADAVEIAREELEAEKADLEVTKDELDATQAQLDAKRTEADELIQELLKNADTLRLLQEEYEAREEDFMKEIAEMEKAYSEAKQAELLAWLATSVPETKPPVQSGGSSGGSSGGGSSGGSSGGGSSGGGGGGWIKPCAYTSVTSPFGQRTHPVTGELEKMHYGVDLDGTTGQPIWAARGGVVSSSRWDTYGGNTITINHGDGFSSVYMHLNTRSVSAGQTVTQGQVIGTMGSTGKYSTGDHLHFGIMYKGVYVNPMGYI